MTHADERPRLTPAERFEGTEHVYDLAASIERLKHEPRPMPGGHRQVTLFKHPTSTMSVFYFEAGSGLPEHKADGFVTIHVLKGRMAVKTADNAHDLTAGQIVVLSPGVRHSITAGENSEMLLIINLM
jgi:quercetin dioxygenase-like cupin family protein